MKLLIPIGIIILPVIAFGLFLSQILFTNNLAQDGSKLKDVTFQVDAVASENEQLEQKIALFRHLSKFIKKQRTAVLRKPNIFSLSHRDSILLPSTKNGKALLRYDALKVLQWRCGSTGHNRILL